MEKRTYGYDGPVMQFGKVLIPRWKGETRAATVGKARSNLTFRAKEELGLLPYMKVTLPGKITHI